MFRKESVSEVFERVMVEVHLRQLPTLRAGIAREVVAQNSTKSDSVVILFFRPRRSIRKEEQDIHSNPSALSDPAHPSRHGVSDSERRAKDYGLVDTQSPILTAAGSARESYHERERWRTPACRSR